MNPATRKLFDRTFTGFGVATIVFVGAALIVILLPMMARGVGAVVFTATVEHRRLMLEQFHRGSRPRLEKEIREAYAAREPVYQAIAAFERDLEKAPLATRRQYTKALRDVKKALHELLGPFPGAPRPILMRDQYGQTRWDRARVKLNKVLYEETWDYSDPRRPGVRVLKSRAELFAGTPVADIFPLLRDRLDRMLLPRLTFYPQFFTDESFDSHFFGGIWPEMLGTFYLTLGALLFAVPMGVVAAIYLAEYARENIFVNVLRICISSLAGVPSIVFGLFGLAFFIHTLHVSESKSVLAGSLTLAVLILPTVIRTSEEAIRTVPHTYKEAALSLGASRWHAVRTIILPAALPGILTGIVISMGRAAGETAPIIFTAAVSVGKSVKLWHIFSQPTPALSWNIFNVATEHEAVDEIRHVQFGLVFTLVLLVLLLIFFAIVARARIAKRLRA